MENDSYNSYELPHMVNTKLSRRDEEPISLQRITEVLHEQSASFPGDESWRRVAHMVSMTNT